MTNEEIRENLDAQLYKSLTGKPISNRPVLSPDREKVVSRYARMFWKYPDAKFECREFSQALCAVFNMYEKFLDATYELTDAEIDDVCFRGWITRHNFDRHVEIAKLQKQVPGEIRAGQAAGKKWAYDPAILAACPGII